MFFFFNRILGVGMFLKRRFIVVDFVYLWGIVVIVRYK